VIVGQAIAATATRIPITSINSSRVNARRELDDLWRWGDMIHGFDERSVALSGRA